MSPPHPKAAIQFAQGTLPAWQKCATLGHFLDLGFGLACLLPLVCFRLLSAV
jgi:hypothetical protein